MADYLGIGGGNTATTASLWGIPPSYIGPMDYSFGAIGGQSAQPLTPNITGTPMQSSMSSFGIPSFPYGTAAITAIQLPFAIKAYIDAKKAILPQYGLTDEMKHSIYEGNQLRNVGFTGSERAGYEQGLIQDRDAMYRKAVEMSGGSMAQAILSILNSHNVDTRNKLAGMDATLRRQNIAQSNALNAQGQDISNTNTALNVDQYNRKQQASAALMQSTLGNLGTSLNFLGGMI